MRVIDYLNPEFEPSSTRQKDAISAVRQRILRYIMLFISAACLAGYLFLAAYSISQKNPSLLARYTILTAAVIACAMYRRVPYKLRAFVFIAMIYALGIYASFNAGAIGDGKLFLLSFIFYTGIFFGSIPGVLAFVLSIITAVLSNSFVKGSFLLPQPAWADATIAGSEWLVPTIFMAVLGALITLTLAVLISNLQQILERQTAAYEAREKDKAILGQKIIQATEDVERRAIQIRTAADIARSISSLRDPKTILQRVVDEIQQRFDLYYAGVFLMNESQIAVLKAGTGEAGQKMVAAGHHLPVGGASMVGWCIANRQPRIALDVGTEAVRFNNPFLPETRSELALPILSRGEALGALSIQSTKPNAFDENDIRVLQAITDSLAITIENANLFERTQQSLEEIRSLNQAYLKQGWAEASPFHGDLRYTFENKPSGEDDTGNIIQVPMMLRDQVIGQISLETDRSDLSPDDLEFVEAVTTQTALALENARLIDETQRKAYQEETVSRLSVEFSRGLNIDEIVTAAVKELSHLPKVSEVSICLSSPENPPAFENNGHDLENPA